MKPTKILGFGEIGKSLFAVYERAGHDVAWKDLTGCSGPRECDILNVAIPFSDSFEETVTEEIKMCGAKIVIIHSTVAPGTTRKLLEAFDYSITIVHSPVIGVHPNLADGILTFTKWVGCNHGIQDLVSVAAHFEEMHVNCHFVFPAEATELFKVMDTTYYGLCLAINAEVRDWGNELGVDYRDWVAYLQNYNRGYIELGMKNVVRPYFEKLSTPIGGHCIGNNVRIIEQMRQFPALEEIKKYGNHES